MVRKPRDTGVLRPKKTRSTKGRAGARARSRFSADEARSLIIAAAGKRLREVGPQGLRLEEIARDVGLSHPTVLHHFGSRDGLLAAVSAHELQSLERELLACFTDPASADLDPRTFTLGNLARVDD